MAGRVDDSSLPLAGLGLKDRNAGVWLGEAVIAVEGKVQQNGHEDTVEPSVGDDQRQAPGIGFDHRTHLFGAATHISQGLAAIWPGF